MTWGVLPGEEKIESEIEAKFHEHPPGRRFENLNVFVTGAGKGFGALLALSFAKEGANVIVTYNTSKQDAERTAGQISSLGRKSVAVKLDVTSWSDIRTTIKKQWSEFGPIDVLVNSAGDMASKQTSWREITEELIDHAIAVDLKGPLYLMHEVGQRMLQRKTGTIVNVASHVIVLGSPRAPQYAAAKSGLIGLTKSYALALAPWVRVNAACPGYIDTEGMRKRPDWTPERRKWVIEHTPLKRIAKPEHIVPIVLFLASDDSINMTGNMIVADGGETMPGA